MSSTVETAARKGSAWVWVGMTASALLGVSFYFFFAMG